MAAFFSAVVLLASWRMLRLGLILLALCGGLIFGGYLRAMYVPEAPLAEGQHQLTVRSLADPSKLASGMYRGLVVSNINGRSFRLRMYSRNPWRARQSLEVRGTLERPESPKNPGQADYAAWLLRQGIAGHFFANEHVAVSSYRPGILDVLRSFIRGNMARLPPLPQSLGEAIVLGDAGVLPATERENWRRAGVSHVLAVSGTHITIFAGAGYVLLRRVVGYQAAYFWAGLLAVLYALIVGDSLSAWRAALTFALFAAGNVALRKSDPKILLPLVLALILWFSPRALFDVGVQLSFAATTGLIFLTPLIVNLLPGPKWFRYLLAASFSAQLFTLPIIINAFHAYPVYGLLANLVLVPFSSVLLYSAFAVGLFGGMPVIGWVAHLIFALSSGLASWFVRLVAGLPFGSIHLTAIPTGLVVLFYLSLAVIIFSQRLPRVSQLIALLLLHIMLITPTVLTDQGTALTFLSLDQDKVVHLATGGRHFLFGTSNETNSDRIMVPYLRSQGVNWLERIFAMQGKLDGKVVVSTERVLLVETLANVNNLSREQRGNILVTAYREQLSDRGEQLVALMIQERNFRAVVVFAGAHALPGKAIFESSAINVLGLPHFSTARGDFEATVTDLAPQVVVLRGEVAKNGAVRIRIARNHYRLYTYREGRWRYVRTYALPRSSQ